MILRRFHIAIICLTFGFEMFTALVSGEVNVRGAGEKHKSANVRKEINGSVGKLLIPILSNQFNMTDYRRDLSQGEIGAK